MLLCEQTAFTGETNWSTWSRFQTMPWSTAERSKCLFSSISFSQISFCSFKPQPGPISATPCTRSVYGGLSAPFSLSKPRLPVTSCRATAWLGNGIYWLPWRPVKWNICATEEGKEITWKKGTMMNDLIEAIDSMRCWQSDLLNAKISGFVGTMTRISLSRCTNCSSLTSIAVPDMINLLPLLGLTKLTWKCGEVAESQFHTSSILFYLMSIYVYLFLSSLILSLCTSQKLLYSPEMSRSKASCLLDDQYLQ